MSNTQAIQQHAGPLGSSMSSIMVWLLELTINLCVSSTAKRNLHYKPDYKSFSPVTWNWVTGGTKLAATRLLIYNSVQCVDTRDGLRTRYVDWTGFIALRENSGNKKSFVPFQIWHKFNRRYKPFTKGRQIRTPSRNHLRLLGRSTYSAESEVLGVNILYTSHQESNSSIFLDRSQADREEFRENWCDRKGGSRTRVKRDGVRGREETW
jgi:hypothetical protein